MSQFKIVIAPDSFKESMTATEAATAIQNGFQEVFNDQVTYDLIPMADGGEGTTEALKEALKATSIPFKLKTLSLEILMQVMQEVINMKQLL